MIDYTIDPFTETGIKLNNINPSQIFNPNYDVGRKGESTDKYTRVKQNVFKAHFDALNNNPISQNWDDSRKTNLAIWLTAHKIKENGWIDGSGGQWAGFGSAKSAQQFVDGMFKWYPKAMNSLTWKDYVNGLKKNKDGNAYNSVDPNYYNDLFKNFGPGKRAWYEPML